MWDAPFFRRKIDGVEVSPGLHPTRERLAANPRGVDLVPDVFTEEKDTQSGFGKDTDVLRAQFQFQRAAVCL